MFQKNFERNEKVTDLSLCKSSLEKHLLRANYVARIWRQAQNPIVEIEDPSYYGQNEDCPVDWVTEPFSERAAELLIDRENKAIGNEISDREHVNWTDYSDNKL